MSIIFLTNRSICAALILLDLLEQAEIIADLLGDLDEGAQVLGKAASAEAQRRIQEPPADAVVHAHAVGHFLHIGAGRLAQDGDGVDIGDLQRQKGIGRVLDQLRRVDVRDNDRAR